MNCPEKKNLTHPTPGGGGLGVKISTKVREISWTAEKIDKYFFTPPPVGILGGQKNKSPGNVMNGREKS